MYLIYLYYLHNAAVSGKPSVLKMQIFQDIKHLCDWIIAKLKTIYSIWFNGHKEFYLNFVK